MSTNDLVIAVELGTAKIAAVAAVVDSSGCLEIKSLAYVPSDGVQKGSVRDVQEAARGVDNVLGKIERHLKIRASEVWLSASGSSLTSTTGLAMMPIYPSGRAIRRQDIHQVLGNSRKVTLPEGHEQVLAVPREYIVDGQRGMMRPIGLAGSRLEVSTHIVSGATVQIQSAENVIEAAGRKVLGMVPSSLGSGLGVLSEEAMDLGCVVLDIGAGKTDLSVFVDGAYVYQDVIPIGGALVTRDLQQLLRTTFDEAERLKVEHGSALADAADGEETVQVQQFDQDHARPMQRRVLCEIIESRMKELFDLAAESLHGAELTGGTPRSVVLSGGGSLLPGTEELLLRILPKAQIKGGQPMVSGRFAGQVASPMLATVVGVARYALESGDEELAPISGGSGWRDRMRALISKFDRKG